MNQQVYQSFEIIIEQIKSVCICNWNHVFSLIRQCHNGAIKRLVTLLRFIPETQIHIVIRIQHSTFFYQNTIEYSKSLCSSWIKQRANFSLRMKFVAFIFSRIHLACLCEILTELVDLLIQMSWHVMDVIEGWRLKDGKCNRSVLNEHWPHSSPFKAISDGKWDWTFRHRTWEMWVSANRKSFLHRQL